VAEFGKAEDKHVVVAAPEGVRAGTQREPFAEEADGLMASKIPSGTIRRPSA
jgi:hypothetical protein